MMVLDSVLDSEQILERIREEREEKRERKFAQTAAESRSRVLDHTTVVFGPEAEPRTSYRFFQSRWPLTFGEVNLTVCKTQK